MKMNSYLDAKDVSRILGFFIERAYGKLDQDGISKLFLFPEGADETHTIIPYAPKHSSAQIPHRIQGIEIQMIVDGSVTENINGKTIRIPENSLLIHSQNVTRAVIPGSDDTGRTIHVYIDGKQFDQRFFTLVMEDNMFANYIYNALRSNNQNSDYILVKNLRSGVREIFNSLLQEYNAEIGEPQNTRVLYSWIAVLFLRLYDYCREIEYETDNDDLESGYKKRLISSIINFIQDHTRTVTLNEVAKAVHLHPNYICKIIRESTGKTFTEILNANKIQLAIQMLVSSDDSLEKIATSIGYSNPNYFYKVFKNHCGQTPGQYRKQQESKSQQFNGVNEVTTSVKLDPDLSNNLKNEVAIPSTTILAYTPPLTKRPRIGFFPAAAYKYIMEVGQGLSYAAEKFGATTHMYIPTQDNVNEQVKLLNNAIEDHLDVVVVNAHDEYAVAPVLKKLIDLGKMVCLINRDDSNQTLDVHMVIGYRQREATRKLGEYMVGKMRGLSARVGIIQGKTGYHSIERCGGFLDAIKRENNFEVLAIFNGNWSAQGGYEAGMQMLQSQPSINLIFCANDHEAVGVARAIEELGLRNIMLLGNDGDSDALQNILEGKMTATVGTNSYELGSVAAQVIQRGLEGNLQNGFIETQTQVVDASNAQIYLNLAKSYAALV